MYIGFWLQMVRSGGLRSKAGPEKACHPLGPWQRFAPFRRMIAHRAQPLSAVQRSFATVCHHRKHIEAVADGWRSNVLCTLAISFEFAAASRRQGLLVGNYHTVRAASVRLPTDKLTLHRSSSGPTAVCLVCRTSTLQGLLNQLATGLFSGQLAPKPIAAGL